MASNMKKKTERVAERRENMIVYIPPVKKPIQRSIVEIVINNIDNQEKLDKFAKVSSWSTRPGHLLKEIGSLLDNYRSTLQSYEEYKEYCKNLIEENNFYEKRLLKSIVDIKAWHSIIK